MPYCYNCGTEIDVKDRKCEKCSHPVQGGMTFGEDGVYSVRKASTNAFVLGLREVIEFVYQMVKAPIDTMQKLCDSMKVSVSFGLFVLLAIVNGGLFVWGGNIINTAMTSKAVNPMVNSSANMVSPLIKFQWGKVFYEGGIFFIICSILYFILLYLLSRFVFKSKIKAFTLWKLSVCSFIPCIIGVAAAFALSYFSAMVALIALALSIITSVICVYKALEQELSLRSSRTLLVTLLTYGLFLAAINIIIEQKINSIINSYVISSLLQGIFNSSINF